MFNYEVLVISKLSTTNKLSLFESLEYSQKYIETDLTDLRRNLT